MSRPRYYAVSDESQITAARYRSIAAVSVPVDSAARCNSSLGRILAGHDVAEFRWHELASAKRRFCALALVDYVFDVLLQADGRVDTLVWDTQNARHTIPNRDDTKNFERMYFHLHNAVMRRRGRESIWHLRPDEKLGIDWPTLYDCLSCSGAWRHYRDHPVLIEEFSIAHFEVKSLEQARSCDLPLCQLADLFAGMAAFTRTKPELVRTWLAQSSGQGSLLDEPSVVRLSNSEQERLAVISHFNARAKALRLGVSLRTAGYLRTPDPANPLNFWHYTPQHFKDRAPTRAV
jgi:hypothetical protein